MTYALVALVVLLAAVRLGRRRWPPRRGERATGRASRLGHSDVALVMSRELRERFRGRMFRFGTLVILVVVAAAIVIPALQHGSTKPRPIGVVGSLSARARTSVVSIATREGLTVRFVPEADVASARRDLLAKRIRLAIVEDRQVLVRSPLSTTDVSLDSQLVRAIAESLGVARAFAAAHLTPAQVEALSAASALPVASVEAGTAHSVDAVSLVGVILIFMMLSQYNTWILIGVMEEKSSRVIEVLLSAVRPIRLLTGKVLGIGLVALSQATLIVAFALALSAAVGSSLLHGTSPLVVASTLVWLVLGYAFYCWVYAAAGSMVERQDQVQSLALPLSLPMVVGYIVAITGASTGNPSALVKVLAYLPPTAPFCMPVLVGASAVAWWGFLISALVSVACTVGVARLAAVVYRRAILRTGGRVRIRDLVASARA